MAKWRTLSSEVVYETPWIKVHRDEVLNHNGKPLTYSYVELHNPSVFIVAMNNKNEVLLIKNYRYVLNREMWELPAGYSDGQDFLKAAKRELLEETGLSSNDWTQLGTTLYQANGIGNIPFVTFLAQNVKETTAERDENEEISEQKFVSLKKLDDMITHGELCESAHITSLYIAKLHLLEKEENNGSTNN